MSAEMRAAEGKMAVAERFVSINGEGLRAGRLSAFVRFAGCDLACSYCDTAWARTVSGSDEHLTVAAIVDWAFAQPTACVTLTGGEPLEQPLFASLVAAMLAREDERPRVIEVETNGAQDVSGLVALRDGGPDAMPAWNALSLTIDCKMPSSGMADRMLFSNLESAGAEDAVKFVCGSVEDLRCAKSIIEQRGLALRTNVLISPVQGKLAPASIVEFMKDNGMAYERVQLQLHKLIWPAAERGV